MSVLDKRTREAFKRMATDETDANLIINLLEELVADMRSITAKLDLDAGVVDTDFATTITDDDPTDGI